jgi:hypothetical protein
MAPAEMAAMLRVASSEAAEASSVYPDLAWTQVAPALEWHQWLRCIAWLWQSSSARMFSTYCHSLHFAEEPGSVQMEETCQAPHQRAAGRL